MVSKKTIKGLNFESIEDYFNYIIDSNTNGQKQQAKELYKALSVRQIKHFAAWFLTYYYFEAADNDEQIEAKNAELITYLNS